MKGQDNPLIPNPHPHLLNSIIKKLIIVPSSYQHKKTHKPRKAIRTIKISQSSGPINLVANETVYKEWEDKMERAATTASSLDVEQDSGAMLPYWEMQMLKLGLRLHLNSPMIHLSQEVTHLEVGRTFWATAKVKTVNGECQIQALVDKKKVIITEISIRSNLHLEDVDGTDCLPTAIIFEKLARMGKKIFSNMKREGKDFSGRVTPLFATMMVQANQEEGEDTDILIDSKQTPITTQPSSSKPQKKQSRRKQKKNTEVPHPILDLEHTKTAQAQEIINLKLRVKKLEKKTGFRTHNFKRLYKEGMQSKQGMSRFKLLTEMLGYSHAQLKDKIFDEVQKLFEKHIKWINSFVPMEEDLPSKKVQKEVSSKKKAEGNSKKKSISRKRAKDKKEQESSKRQRVEDDKEEEELKKCFELAKEEEIAINAINQLATKSYQL
ncbi:hypothetical protein Tco_1385754 [Tanacetum coccineum]